MRKYSLALFVSALLLLALAFHSRAPSVGSPALPLHLGLMRFDRITANINETNLSPALIMYSELIGRTELKGGSVSRQIDEFFGGYPSRWHLIKLPPRVPSGIEYHRDGLFTVGELKDHLEALFAANQLILIPEGKKHFRTTQLSKASNSSPSPPIEERRASSVQ
jgi:hypothetical protein